VCWNCDATVNEVMAVAIQAPSGKAAAVSLCRDCYVSTYLPLAARAPELRLLHSGSRAVLVIDDDPGIRGLLTTLFQGEGYRVETASNGLEALQKARARVPDAIILDLRMPVMGGHEFLQKWRQTAPGPAVPVLAMSAYDVAASAEDLGVQAFLPKPFSMDMLLSTLDHLVDPVVTSVRHIQARAG
jgi:CheY-like chemotaxis protein